MSIWEIFKKPIKSNIEATAEPEENVMVVVKPPEDEPEPESKRKVIEPLDLMSVEFDRSPNQSSRKSGDQVEYIVLHHTGPGSFNGIVSWLKNPDAKASSHYVVGKKAEIKQLVSTKRKAWHAGSSSWDGKRDLNRCSVGIEICNIGHLYKEGEDYYYNLGRKVKKYNGKVEPGSITYPDGQVLEGYCAPYPERQKEKVIALCKALVKLYPAITRDKIITHYQISPHRKNDPFGLDIEEIKTRVFDE